MDIKVTVDGISRDVCGLNDSTTCEDIILKLAQVASLPGFYTLVAQVQNKEITLSPEDKVLHFLQNRKEKASKVRFILRRLEAPISPYANKSQPSAQPDSNWSHHSNRSCSKSRRQDRSNVTNERNDLTVGLHKSPSSSFYTTHNPIVDTNNPINSKTRGYIQNPTIYSSQYNELKDQLAYQEQQVELNRIRILRLDKEIMHLEQANRIKESKSALIITTSNNPVAELAQLTDTPWSQLLDSNRVRQRELLSECERHKIAIDQVDNNLTKTKLNLNNLELQINDGLSQLLNDLESYNQFRRSILHERSLTDPIHFVINTTNGGVPV